MLVTRRTILKQALTWSAAAAAAGAGAALTIAPAAAQSAPATTTALTAAEAEGLQFMREEEKLARDVYVKLYETWKWNTFQNISKSEQTHMESLKTLLTRYGVSDPATGKAAGVFIDSKLQGLYDQLTAQGAQSLESALMVGAAIEEIDILDLDERSAQTTRSDIRQVYANLTKGSRNHLRSFTSVIERVTGQTYEPQYLTPVAYTAIVGAAVERGRARV